MCGIAGFYDPNLSQPEALDLVQSMIESIRHRGEEIGRPFQDKQVSLGHVRLKILDVSDAGMQPMTLGHHTIVFNGEVYNYLEIKHKLAQKGYTFQSGTDTEVILTAYAEWGEKCVEHFVGMWAIAIWDSQKETLFCSRDRFGIKPFYYIYEGDAFYFGSEYKPLRLSRLFNNEINIAQANRGLGIGFASFLDESYFVKIKILEPSHNIMLSAQGMEISRYWDVSNVKKNGMSIEERKGIFSAMFQETLRLHLRSDIQFGCCLSGGLDSSSIVSSIGKYYPEQKLKTFHIYYEGNSSAYVDEREFVYEVLNKYPLVESFLFTPSDEELDSSFQELMYFSDVPVHGSSYLSQYFLMKLARKNGVSVLIDGQGADEYLGGYMQSFYPLFVSLVKKYDVATAIRIFVSHVARQRMGVKQAAMVFLKSVLTYFRTDEVLYNYDLGKIKSLLLNGSRETPLVLGTKVFSKDAFDNHLYNMTFKTQLPTLLHYADRNSMAFTIESRVPFLDHRMVEFMFSTETHDKINHKAETKFLMREAMAGVLPEKVKERRDKKGFVTPGERVWLRGPLRHYLDIDYERLYWLDRNNLKTLLDKYRQGDNTQLRLVWNIASLNQWMKKYA